MEKNIFLSLFLGALVLSVGAFAQQNDDAMGGADEDVMNEALAEPALTSAQVRVGGVEIDPTTTRGQELLQIREGVQTRINQTENDNRMSETHGYMVQSNVKGMLDVADLIEGPMGQQVKTIAQKMNESVNAMTAAEVKTESRSAFARFFFGADREAVATMDQELNRTREHIEEMQAQLLELTDEEAKAIIQEQIQNMEAQLEQVRARVDSESKSKGIFGFLVRNKVSDAE